MAVKFSPLAASVWMTYFECDSWWHLRGVNNVFSARALSMWYCSSSTCLAKYGGGQGSVLFSQLLSRAAREEDCVWVEKGRGEIEPGQCYQRRLYGPSELWAGSDFHFHLHRVKPCGPQGWSSIHSPTLHKMYVSGGKCRLWRGDLGSKETLDPEASKNTEWFLDLTVESLAF